MQFLIRSFLIIHLALVSFSLALAEDKGAGEAPSEKEARVQEWNKRTTAVTGLANKIHETRQQIQKLIVEKNSTQDPAKKHALVEEMIRLQGEMKKDIESYNQGLADLRYRFPEKNDLTERRYLPMREQSLEQIENEIGLDADLTRVKAAVDQKYEPFKGKEEKLREAAREKKQEKDAPPKSERLRLVK